MFKKVLFIVENTQECLDVAEEVVSFLEGTPAQIIALNIINVMHVRHIRKASDKSETEIIMEQEEEGWKYLYMVEDLAKEHNLKILLRQEEGDMGAVIKEGVQEFEADVVAMKGKISQRAGIKNVEKMLSNLIDKVDCPLLIL